jgi:hypothetical protein
MMFTHVTSPFVAATVSGVSPTLFATSVSAPISAHASGD